MKKEVNRRRFIGRTFSAAAAATAFPALIPSSAWSQRDSVLPGERITLGFIGVGKQGSGLLRGFLHTPGAQVLAVCDVDALKLESARESVDKYYSDSHDGGSYTGCAAYRDFRRIMDRTDIDAVVIATPDHWHAIQSIMSAAAGKDIYCEKPLSLTIGEARIMVDEVRRYGRVFQTGSMQRSDSKFRLAAELVQNGYIGDVKEVRVSIRTGFPPFPDICTLPAEPVPKELDWNLWQGPAPERPFHPELAPPITFDGWPKWRNYVDYSGGGMTDWGAHHFDIAQWGLGMDGNGPVEINPPDGKHFELLTYRYATGTVMTVDFENNFIRFIGTDGVVEVNRQYIRTEPESLAQVKIAADEIHLYDSKDHKADWFSAIRTRTRPICDVEIGCSSVIVCHLGNIAVQLNRGLRWNPGSERFMDDAEADRKINRSQRSPWHV